MSEKEKSKCSSLSILCSVSFWPREHLKCAALQSPSPDGATWPILPFCSGNWYVCFDNYSTSFCGLFKLPVHSTVHHAHSSSCSFSIYVNPILSRLLLNYTGQLTNTERNGLGFFPLTLFPINDRKGNLNKEHLPFPVACEALK